MPSILNEITFFQFDNLIRNQIPFIILNLGADLQGLYKVPLFQKHMEKQTVETTAKDALAELQRREVPSHNAILILCPEGQTSPQLVDSLEKAGYSNVFYAKGGVKNLRSDAAH